MGNISEFYAFNSFSFEILKEKNHDITITRVKNYKNILGRLIVSFFILSNLKTKLTALTVI